MKINKTLLYLVLFFAVYGVILAIPYLEGYLFIPITLAESFTFQVVVMSIKLSTLLELFLVAPATGTILILLYDEIRKSPCTSEKYLQILRILLVVFATTMYNGIGVHFAANFAESISGAVVNPANKDLIIYFMDEIVGHKLIHFGMFGCFVVFLWLQYFHPQEEIARLDIALHLVAAIIIGIVFAFALIEGQAAFDLLIMNSVLIGALIFSIKKYGIELRKNQVFLFELSFAATQIPVILIWWIITGMLLGFQPVYPFIYQYHFFF
ncbi:MAG: hypothetical protein ACTSRW_16440 [Candidatus Helarchaeota archaeon]